MSTPTRPHRPGLAPAVLSAAIAAALLAGWIAVFVLTDLVTDGHSAWALHLVLMTALATWGMAPFAIALAVWGIVSGARAGCKQTVILAVAGGSTALAAFAYTLAP